jgi:predicted transcriptional regulator
VALERVEKVLLERVMMLQGSNPELTAEWAIINDDWGLISISQGEELIGFEYVESEISWARPERIRVYEETLNQGLTVVVIVPEEVFLETRRRLANNLGKRAPEVLSYDSIGITMMPRPS